MVFPLDYMSYNKKDAISHLERTIGWKQYGGKHHESIFTRFFKPIIYKSLGLIKENLIYLLIVSNQISREEALSELKKDPYQDLNFEEDRAFVLKKLRLSESEFQKIMELPKKNYKDYNSNYYLYSGFGKIEKEVSFFI